MTFKPATHSARRAACVFLLATVLCLSVAAQNTAFDLKAGFAQVDITPNEEVTLAGSPSPKKSKEVKTRLYVRALVLASDGKKVAIVTLDTLKYPVDLVQKARTSIEQATGIPAANVIICASHTHSGPLWSYYPDKLVTPITEAVSKAAHDLTPCTLGMARGRVEAWPSAAA